MHVLNRKYVLSFMGSQHSQLANKRTNMCTKLLYPLSSFFRVNVNRRLVKKMLPLLQTLCSPCLWQCSFQKWRNSKATLSDQFNFNVISFTVWMPFCTFSELSCLQLNCSKASSSLYQSLYLVFVPLLCLPVIVRHLSGLAVK